MAQRKSPQPEKIVLVNGKKASLVRERYGGSVATMIDALAPGMPDTILLSLGGAKGLDEEKIAKLEQLYTRGFVDAAEALNALVIDGGTDSGIMRITGQSFAQRQKSVTLLGIAPEGKVELSADASPEETDQYPLEPNHTAFILADSDEWGGETKLLLDAAKYFSTNAQVVAVLANGGDTAKKEMLYAAREGWPIIVIRGSGRLADVLAELEKNPSESSADLTEILATGDLHIFDLESSARNFAELLQDLGRKKQVLRQAWYDFFLYDDNAVRQQKTFRRFQQAMLAMGVVGTVLAILQAQFELVEFGLVAWQNNVLRFFIIIAPISVSVLISLSNHLKAGNKWIFLRSGAEEIKQEIFKYRTCSGIYAAEKCATESRQIKLANRLKLITRRVMKTEVNLAGLRDFNPERCRIFAAEKALNDLSPTDYIAQRLDDQKNWYLNKTVQFEKKLNQSKIFIYTIGGIGTLLAALGFELWIAVTTALSGTIVTFLEYRQIENLLMSYNQTATTLAGIKNWWLALPISEQRKPETFANLVKFTEDTLSSESRGWLQQMQDMLDELQEQQSDNKEKT